ncbi:MAG: mechanosensitive ion channel family protein [Saprospiraceae bacterium]|nr:mechanosensitive ion channel family protein [Saprospiraceae bacterium]MCF8252244.1 mechanosensitive ion channel family protein [Saprospiraceae bacterium]MCF8282349.1 mechanosensitive ion channel family protein [Bacteroidales bacterium]MCF8313876.1 mechanosensitive ion channel family protein [Saprospiraceae bacterium]MCF8442895.1 mechanosensitive ion channel family protein [Saprospiraceae bacterium]
MNEEKLNLYYDKIIDFAVTFAPKLAGAIIAIAVGFWLIKKLMKLFTLSLEKANFSKEVAPFLVSFTGIAMKIFVLLAAAGIVGIETTSIFGILAAAGFAVGFALQGSLSNFAAGILIMVFKPYRVDDMVEVNGKFGKVDEIHIFNTILTTPGLKTLIIPNGKVIDDTITNFSAKGAIRIELNVSMPYIESFPKVKKVVMEALDTVPLVLKTPAPEIGIERFDSHNILLAVRPYVKPDDYWEGIFEVHKAVKSAFHGHNIHVAYSEGIEMGTIGE